MKKSNELKNSQEILAQATNYVQAEIRKRGVHRRHPKDTQTTPSSIWAEKTSLLTHSSATS